jgi:integrase
VEVLSDMSPAHQYHQRILCAKFLREVGDLPLADVTPDVLRQWKATMQTQYKPSTVHQYMKRLACVFAYALDCDWIAADPCRKVRKPSPGRGRLRFLTPDERVRLLAACAESRNPHLYAMVTLALNTGGRKNEIRGLLWSHVDVEAEVVRFVKTKTDRDRAVPLVGEALTLMRRLAQHRPAERRLVFPRRDGQAPAAMEMAWRHARRRAGLADFHFHDLRHTFASYMAMSGASLREIADVLGHSTIQVTMLYTHLIPSHTHSVVEKMAAQWLTTDATEVPHVE